MSASQPANFNLQEFSDAGLLLVGGRLYTYAYGTTTHKTAYTDAAALVPQTYTADGFGGLFIALNARGELPAPLYLSLGPYDIALKRADGSTVWTRRADPVGDSVAALSTDAGAGLIGTVGGGTVQTDLDALEAFDASISDPSGSLVVGYVDIAADAVATNSQSRLRELTANAPTAVIPNLGSVLNRNCTILGDSISHGAFANNSFMHAWARIFARCFNAEMGTTSYGFVNFLSLGAGPTFTNDVHSCAFSGSAWSSVDSATDAGAADYPAGMAMRPADATSLLTISVPSFQSRALIYYGKRPSSVDFTIKVNGVLAATVSTNGVAGWSTQEVVMVDNGYGENVISIQSTAGAVQPDIIGISYLSSVLEPVVNNFATSGRRLRYLGQNLINAIMQESASMIVALGHNDQADADADNTYYAAFMQRITWLTTYAKQYGVRLIVPDFCWSAAPSSRTRLALRKLAADTAGIYIDLPGELFKNRESIPAGADRYNFLINTYKMWVDGSHPNKFGHQWIAETIAKRLGLSCSSKSRAINYHDWWMPISLKPATLVYNFFTTPSNVSSYRRNGSEIVIRCFLHMSPAASFPVGTYVIQDAWRALSEMSVYQGYSAPAVLRADTGANVSSFYANASGQLTLKVVDGAWINAQDFTLSMPSA